MNFATSISTTETEPVWGRATAHRCLRVCLLPLPLEQGPKTAAPTSAESSGWQEVAESGSTDPTHASGSHLPLKLLCKLLPSRSFVPGGKLSWVGFVYHLSFVSQTAQSSAECTILGGAFVCHFPFVSLHAVVCRGCHLGGVYSSILSFSLFPKSLRDFSNFVTSDYCCYFFAYCYFNFLMKLLFFHLYLLVFVSPYWWKGIG